MNVSMLRSAGVVCLLLGSFGSLSAQVYNSNLINNPGADAGLGSLSGWTSVTGGMEAVAYGTSGGFPSVTDPGPSDRGANFFGGGNYPFSEITQTLSLASYQSTISSGSVDVSLSAYFGGFASQNDYSSLTLKFKDASDTELQSITLVGPTAADRGNQTEFLSISYLGEVPLSATSATLLLDATRTDGTYNDGYADSLSLVLSTTSTGPGSSPVPEPSTYGLLGCAALGLLAVKKRFVRR